MATETLRPNANTGSPGLSQTPRTGSNYDKVDEVGAHDGDSTYVHQDSESEGPDKDIYEIENSAVGAGTITKVTVKIVAKKHAPE